MKLANNLYFYPEKGMLDCNTYVIRDELSIIIDPGFPQFLPALIRDLELDGIKPSDIDIIANTHLHIDHCWANKTFQELSSAKIILHPLQKKFYDITVIETSKFFGLQPLPEGFKEDSCFDNSGLSVGETKIELIPSPGHSPDSICFYWEKDKILICGDVIFRQNTGRVDLPGGDGAKLRESIGALSKLEIAYLLPGHMDIVSGAERVKENFEFVEKNILDWL
jgi:glyoxylase-like metal-dependent hydrolase (beta-lactamase superfamily II)